MINALGGSIGLAAQHNNVIYLGCDSQIIVWDRNGQPQPSPVRFNKWIQIENRILLIFASNILKGNVFSILNLESLLAQATTLASAEDKLCSAVQAGLQSELLFTKEENELFFNQQMHSLLFSFIIAGFEAEMPFLRRHVFMPKYLDTGGVGFAHFDSNGPGGSIYDPLFIGDYVNGQKYFREHLDPWGSVFERWPNLALESMRAEAIANPARVGPPFHLWEINLDGIHVLPSL